MGHLACSIAHGEQDVWATRPAFEKELEREAKKVEEEEKKKKKKKKGDTE
jgi:hypothetical protein